MIPTEPLPPVPEADPLDEAASAVVDGVATAEETALVAASPGGNDRVLALAAVADAVGQPVPDQHESSAAQALAAALAAFDMPEADGGAQTAIHRMVPNSSVVRPPPGSATASRWLPRLGAAAAAVVVLAGVAALAGGLLGSKNEATSLRANTADLAAGPSTTRAASEAAGNTKTLAEASTAASRPAGATTPPPAMAMPTAGAQTVAPKPPSIVDGGDVGAQTDIGAIARLAAAALDSPSPTSTRSDAALPTDVQTCVNSGAGATLGDLRYRAVGTFQGALAVILAYEHPGRPPRQVVVLTRQGCTVLAFTPF